jgi:AcrR family transcriptional regulator
MTMDAVAARARASKATIYRRWHGKREMVVDALRCRGPQPMEAADTGSLRGDLIDTFRAARDGISGQDFELLAGVLRAMRKAPEIADEMRDQMLEQKRATARTIVHRAIERGELATGADPDVLHEVGSALLVFRVLVTGEPVDDAFITHLADDVLVPLLVASAARTPVPSARQEML